MTREQQKRLNALLGDLERDIRLTTEGAYVNRAGCPDGFQVDKDSFRWMFVGTYRGNKFVPALEGHGFILLGGSSRDLTVSEASEVMTMIEAFGAKRNVAWTDPEWQAMCAQEHPA